MAEGNECPTFAEPRLVTIVDLLRTDKIGKIDQKDAPSSLLGVVTFYAVAPTKFGMTAFFDKIEVYEAGVQTTRRGASIA